MKGKKFCYLVAALLAFLVISSCGGGGDGGGAPATGTLSLGLTDASTNHYRAVYVTIAEVRVHMPGDRWKVIPTTYKTYNLLDLVNGVREQLGIAELNAGHYTQMRLIIGETPDGGINILSKKHQYANYVIDQYNNEHELKVPSGYQTGIKIVHGFTISANQTTELILDFDASKSVVVAGKSGNYLLKPTIKVLNTDEYGILSGCIVDGDVQSLSGVKVTAQKYNGNAIDSKDSVIVKASTYTDAEGLYKLFLEPGIYTIVAYADGYSVSWKCDVSALQGTETEVDPIMLSTVDTGTVSEGNIIISGASGDQYATLSFRQRIDCGGSPVDIEVKSINVVATEVYFDEILPSGDYYAVLWIYDLNDQEIKSSLPVDFSVSVGDTTHLDIIL
jgi:hypothetical protein